MICTAQKVFKYGVFFVPCFPVFGLNTEIYSGNFCIQSNTGKYGPENSVFGHFSRSDNSSALYVNPGCFKYNSGINLAPVYKNALLTLFILN